MSQEYSPHTHTHTHALALGQRPKVWQNWAKLSPRVAGGRCNLMWSAIQSPRRWQGRPREKYQAPGLKSKGTEAAGEAKAKIPKDQELGEE